MSTNKTKAIFLDRDGVIIEMVYDLETGLVHTPLNSAEVKLQFGFITFAKKAQKLGYKLFVISNQPDIGLKRSSKENFFRVHNKMDSLLKKNDVIIDEYYYCFHHPFAKDKSYKIKCKCRKPQPGLIITASKNHNIDTKASWMIGDGIHDIVAGNSAGLKTILIANIQESEYLRIIEQRLNDIKPIKLVKNIKHAIEFI